MVRHGHPLLYLHDTGLDAGGLPGFQGDVGHFAPPSQRQREAKADQQQPNEERLDAAGHGLDTGQNPPMFSVGGTVPPRQCK